MLDQAGQFDQPPKTELAPLPGDVWRPEGLQHLLGFLAKLGVGLCQHLEPGSELTVGRVAVLFQTVQLALNLAESLGEALRRAIGPHTPEGEEEQ